MDSETRQQRVANVLETMERNWSPWKRTDPLATLWIALTAAAATARSTPERKASLLLSAVTASPANPPSDLFRIPETPLHWLGLSLNQAGNQARAMFTPELPHAHWQANPGEPGYINMWAIRKMMTCYAKTGTVRWPQPMRPPEQQQAIAEVCRSQGVNTLHWSPQDGIAIAIRDGLLPDRSRLQRQLSDILNDDVSIKTPGDLRPEQLEQYQARSRLIYREPAYAPPN